MLEGSLLLRRWRFLWVMSLPVIWVLWIGLGGFEKTHYLPTQSNATHTSNIHHKHPTNSGSQHKTQQPLLVLHVGPGKTATTSLQVDLGLLQDSLRQDGYWYGGRYYPHAHFRQNGVFVEGRQTYSPLLEILREILIPSKTYAKTFGSSDPHYYCPQDGGDCWDTFRDELVEDSKEHGPSILLSDEPLALRWSTERFAALSKTLLEGSHLKPLVVVSYRRFYEWLPSSIYQRNRKRLQDTEWPSDLSALQQLWPNMANSWRNYHYTFMDTLVDQATQAGVDWRVLNIHDLDSSVRTTFLCHVLPQAVSSCQLSREMDRQQEQKSTAKVNVRTHEKVQRLYYDILTTEAAQQGLINKKAFTRVQVRQALQEYMASKNQTAADFDMHCPTPHELEGLYNQSLALEARYIWPSKENSTRQELQAQHRMGFQKMVDAQEFCVVDTRQVTTNGDLYNFFSRFS